MASMLDSFDIYTACEVLAGGDLLRGFRFASLRTGLNDETARNFETMFRNRSINYRFFVEYEAAKSWLCGTQDQEESKT
ncbi:hypothetical protein [Pseudodesulfovibrio sediminis]|nr:hypothetical protein [Pseudodesulfovibrio sediminis]